MRQRSRVTAKGGHSACTFARDILAERISEPLAVISRVSRESMVEELWESTTRLFAVTHTTVTPVSEHGEEVAGFLELRSPLLSALSGRLPGRFHLYLGTRGSLNSSTEAAVILDGIEREMLNVARQMSVGEWRTLTSPSVPFPIQVYRADATGSDLLVGRRVGEIDAVRLARTRRVLAQTCPLLDRAAARSDATSVLILEYPDRNRANGCLTRDAILLALSERSDQPDIVLFVETEVTPFHAWIVADRVDLYPAGRRLPQFYDGAKYSLSS
jgi:hypothetical protein